MGLFSVGNLATAGALGALAPVAGVATAANMGTDIFNSYMTWKNYQLQKENLDYQKGLQSNIFAREDTAVQRRVKDLVAAGLSPTLAAGSAAGAGAAIPTQAPQMGDLKNEMMQRALQLMTMEKDFAMKDQQISNLQKQKSLYDAQITNAYASATKSATDAKRSNYDLEWARTGGANGAMPSNGAPGFAKGIGVTNNAIQEIRRKLGLDNNSEIEPGGGRFRGGNKSGKSGKW